MATSILSFTEITVLIWVLWTVAFLTTAFRGTFQWILQRRLFIEDYMVFFGLISLTALTAVITRLLPHFYLAGEYTKAAAVNPLTPLPLPVEEFTARTVTSLKLMFSQMLLFWTTLWAAKFSILFFVKRLVDGLPLYIRAWWACFTTVLLLYLASMLSNFFTCTPLTKYWSPTGCSDPGDLVRADASIKFATAADVVADILIMLLPLHLLRSLKTNRAHKAGLVVLFSLGGIIIAFAFARLVQVTKATSDTAKDPTTVANGPVLLSMWSHIESSVGIIVATLPAFRFLLSKNRQNITGKTPEYTRTSNKWKKGSVRLAGAESGASMPGSETELGPMKGSIQKDVEYSVEQTARTSSIDEARRTREMFS
ncbi:hypothetical protein F5X68DRAFT_157439 [Plectosphaerella plurivora]|uniref:Rhodopsin domain-containing protein n=1 Tax=Plectosphaerella plurivora TaxID=936078 RepID=A0A9P8V672_9PEZI|nr:hypothetical protein F5X68DRAFT_157439 [Plectosphaerella plurivora]